MLYAHVRLRFPDSQSSFSLFSHCPVACDSLEQLQLHTFPSLYLSPHLRNPVVLHIVLERPLHSVDSIQGFFSGFSLRISVVFYNWRQEEGCEQRMAVG